MVFTTLMKNKKMFMSDLRTANSFEFDLVSESVNHKTSLNDSFVNQTLGLKFNLLTHELHFHQCYCIFSKHFEYRCMDYLYNIWYKIILILNDINIFLKKKLECSGPHSLKLEGKKYEYAYKKNKRFLCSTEEPRINLGLTAWHQVN